MTDANQGATGAVDTPRTDWTIGEAITGGWNAMRRSPVTIAICAVGFTGSIALPVGAAIFREIEKQRHPSADANDFAKQFIDDQVHAFGIGLLNTPISAFFALGLVRCGLAALRAQPVTFGALFSGGRFLSMLGATIIISLATSVGMLLCLVPGVFLSICWMFTGSLITDRQLGAIDALRASWRMTAGQRLELFGFVLVTVLLVGAGVLACGVGVLVTGTVGLLALLHVYLRISGERPAA